MMMRLFLILLLLLLTVSAGLAFWSYRDLRKPVYHSRAGQYITIPRGSSPPTVVKKLAAEGIIKHQWPLLIYLKLSGVGLHFRAGEYRFPSPVAPLVVADKLQKGEER